MQAYSVYVHVPFCRRRCSYCDFNTYAGQEGLIPAYVDAVVQEIGWVAQAAGERLAVHTVYFGGGTPSLLPTEGVERILTGLAAGFELQGEAEITLEANPGTVEREGLARLRAAGVNRLSLGMQSVHGAELALLGREHDFWDVMRAVQWARQAGFDNVNLDLIFGLPGQSLAAWQQTLSWAIRLGVEHLSLYALSVEAGTSLQRWVEGGLVPVPDDDLAADMYELASEWLAREGYWQYEISNWARSSYPPGETEAPSRASRHNLQYWRNQPYLGVGAGAHGYAAGQRVANVRLPAEYIRRLSEGARSEGERVFPQSPATAEVVTLKQSDEIAETMMMGLRLTREGVSAQAFEKRFGIGLEVLFGPQIEQLRRQGLLTWAGQGGDRLRLTAGGRLLGNRVFAAFV